MAPLTLPAETQRDGDDLHSPAYHASVQAAKAANALDRHRVFVETGVRVDGEGHFILPERSFADIGMAMGNFMSAAIYGARGEHR